MSHFVLDYQRFFFFEDLEIQPGMFLSVVFAQTVDSTMLYLF